MRNSIGRLVKATYILWLCIVYALIVAGVCYMVWFAVVYTVSAAVVHLAQWLRGVTREA